MVADPGGTTPVNCPCVTEGMLITCSSWLLNTAESEGFTPSPGGGISIFTGAGNINPVAIEVVCGRLMPGKLEVSVAEDVTPTTPEGARVGPWYGAAMVLGTVTGMESTTGAGTLET